MIPVAGTFTVSPARCQIPDETIVFAFRPLVATLTGHVLQTLNTHLSYNIPIVRNNDCLLNHYSLITSLLHSMLLPTVMFRVMGR